MKNIVLMILLMSLSSGIMAQQTVVNGDIAGHGDGQLIINSSHNGESKIDTVNIKNGKFTWKGYLKEPQNLLIKFPSKNFQFYADNNEHISIVGTADSISRLRVYGSKVQDEADLHKKSLQDLTDKEMAIYKLWGEASEEERSGLEKRIYALRRERRERGVEYISKNPDSYFSLNLVNNDAITGSYEDIAPTFKLLSSRMQRTVQGIRLAERLELLKRSRLGEEMFDFTQNDQDGNAVNFNDFRGKYVLVDFWASWCGPCRAENPNVLAEYNKYKEKNFTVLGISLDEDALKWKEAIKQDQLPWLQVSDLKGFDNEVSAYYGIGAIPSTLLVDPDGKIIAKDLRGEMLSSKLKELFED
ncbi:redoxin domain-containing protein [Sphingobacterium corticis]|uniref:Redoxin domain-containing protein n=1 Tax=Sphingobacterium corticis TaxID=1812823 RepID=A0ABW5NIJ9_9SPHI